MDRQQGGPSVRSVAPPRERRVSAELRALANHSSLSVVGVSTQGIMTSWNAAAAHVFGYAAEEALGQSYDLLLQGELADEFQQFLQQVLNGQKVPEIETARIRKDGSRVEVAFAIYPVKHDGDGKISGAVATALDISDRLRSEQALREQIKKTEQVNASLAKTNKELAQTNALLRDAQGQLVEAEKMASLGGLVAGVAHEINTPLGVGLAAATHFQDSANDIQKAYTKGQLKKSTLEEFLEISGEASTMILSNLRRAAELIKSFKQISVDQTHSECREFDLEEYLEGIILSLKPGIQQSGVTVTLSCASKINMHSYPGALAQVITNLVMNAVVHAFEAGQSGVMSLTVSLSEQQVKLVFADDGKGIPQENLARIFDPFFTTRRSAGGTGLGLSVTYNLVTQTLGGTVTVESEVGKGTWFTLLLPPRVED